MMEGPGCADSEEKHEPVSDIDTVMVGSLKTLDPNRPIREADIEDMVISPRLECPLWAAGSCRGRSKALLTTLKSTNVTNWEGSESA